MWLAPEPRPEPTSRHFRRISTRYDRSATNFMAAAHIVATIAYWLWVRTLVTGLTK